MSSVDRSIHIAAPVEEVWAVLEDVRRLPDLSPSTVAVDGPARLRQVGDTFRQTVEVAGRSFTSEWTVTEIEPGRALVVEGSIAPGTHYEMAERLSPDGDGTTLSLEMTYRLPFGPLGRLAARLGLESRAIDEASTVLTSIRDRVESRITS